MENVKQIQDFVRIGKKGKATVVVTANFAACVPQDAADPLLCRDGYAATDLLLKDTNIRFGKNFADNLGGVTFQIRRGF